TSELLSLLTAGDPFLRHAAIRQLGRNPTLLDAIDVQAQKDPRHRIGLLLAHRASGRDKSRRLLSSFLTDADDELRFLAAKWIADEKLKEHRPFLVEALKDRHLNVRLFTAYSTAFARIEGKEVNDAELANYFMARLTDESSGAGLRVLSLQNVP